MEIPRSALIIGIAGAVFFLVAGIYGVVRGGGAISVLFLLIGIAGIVGGVILYRRIGPRR